VDAFKRLNQIKEVEKKEKSLLAAGIFKYGACSLSLTSFCFSLVVHF